MRTAVASQGEKPLGEADVDPAEGDLVDDAEQVDDPLSIGAKDEGSERGRAGCEIVEHRAGKRHGLDLGLGHAFDRVVLIADHAGGGHDAALARLDPAEHDLAPRFGTLADPHRAAPHQQQMIRDLPGRKDRCARRQTHDSAARFQFGPQIRRQPDQLAPVTRAPASA
jgi:hypothetical protein